MTAPELSSTPRTALRRLRERGRTDRDELYSVLDTGLICHLGVIAGGVPRVLPTGYGRDGDVLYLHGSSANATFTAGRDQEVCVTVTHLDGIVYARSVFHHSMNYRSAMIFGVARPVTDPAERVAALRVITEHLAPGQWSYARQPTAKELAATSVLALPLTEASVKVRSGFPSDDPEDYAMEVWAGVVPVTAAFGDPEPDAALRPGTETPPHVRRRGAWEILPGTDGTVLLGKRTIDCNAWAAEVIRCEDERPARVDRLRDDRARYSARCSHRDRLPGDRRGPQPA